MEPVVVDREEFNEMKRKLEEIELSIKLDKKLEAMENGIISSKTVDSQDFIKRLENEDNL